MGISAAAMTEVRVGIVSWNTADHLDRCLAAVPAALAGLEAEVVVVDNASDDDSVEVARAHPGVRVDPVGANLGYARGMNRALAGSDAPTLIALNPDTVPGPGTLRALVERLLADPRLGCVAPRLVNADGSLQHSVHRFPSLGLAAAANLLPVGLLRGQLGRSLWIEGSVDHRASTTVDWAIGAVHVLRAAAVGERPYCERWFMYVEDLDLCWRLRQAGWATALAAEVEVTHVGNAAGAQQWGADRTNRWLVATYDWYARSRGTTAARAYATLNLTGSVVKGGYAAVRGRLGGARAPTGRAAALRRTIPTHLGAMVQPSARTGTVATPHVECRATRREDDPAR